MFQGFGKITRRSFLGGSIAAIAGLSSCNGFEFNKNGETGAARGKRSLRFAHMTDIHLRSDKNAPEGFALALKHIHSHKDMPEMIITGGDHLIDTIGENDQTTEMYWTLFKDIMKKECRLPVKYCVGNHDYWGINKKKSGTTGNEPNWGVKRMLQELDITDRYYSFDKGNWRLIVLDSIVPTDTYCIGKIEADQFAWLEDQIKSAGEKYIAIFTHIPIVSVGAYFYGGNNEKTGDWIVPGSRMIINARQLKDLFWQHKNVKLCVSGHIHLLEHIVYNDVHYISDGAVCGRWWKGPHQETQEGYGLFDLYDDGTFEHQYIDYGWNINESD
ncbi:MAG: metallophosphoesterase [Planctomycetaceae bacterium]|nr:metallophosphoesterase [Planctomycetaceae bacterium]